MENELYKNMEMPNDVFDKWLAEQLKENVVEPPANFTSKVLAGIEGKSTNGNSESIWIIILLTVSLFMAIAISAAYLIPAEYFRKINLQNIIEITGSIKKIVLFGTLALLGVSFFYGIDNFFENRYRNNNVAIY